MGTPVHHNKNSLRLQAELTATCLASCPRQTTREKELPSTGSRCVKVSAPVPPVSADESRDKTPRRVFAANRIHCELLVPAAIY